MLGSWFSRTVMGIMFVAVALALPALSACQVWALWVAADMVNSLKIFQLRLDLLCVAYVIYFSVLAVWYSSRMQLESRAMVVASLISLSLFAMLAFIAGAMTRLMAI
jgi:hypothetical protein